MLLLPALLLLPRLSLDVDCFAFDLGILIFEMIALDGEFGLDEGINHLPGLIKPRSTIACNFFKFTPNSENCLSVKNFGGGLFRVVYSHLPTGIPLGVTNVRERKQCPLVLKYSSIVFKFTAHLRKLLSFYKSQEIRRGIGSFKKEGALQMTFC